MLSIQIFEKYERILKELTAQYHSVDVAHILEAVSFHAIFLTAPVFLKQICTDPDDDKFLSTAITPQANAIITADQALLAMNGLSDMDSINPSAFLNKLQKNKMKFAAIEFAPYPKCDPLLGLITQCLV